ncbi:tetratricopeptide repeat protein [Ichthyenterobacterium sp. W332]|uniref:histidine kinase n=1 Tax=Microcosmobacter mediterraneus TaxID=3075607 RepID=A0ABU2YG01_9FLAO|nr:tetratricopeptide repeat protein [Ichthyenterobacterium sp. W332]MDT0557109.1 tetratricopeptide repeat protein [Ichthyenterobacterium sp. W332]
MTFSQDNIKIIDSIIKVAKNQSNDSLAIESLHKSFFNYCYAKPEISRAIGDQSIALSKDLKTDYLLIRSYLRKGIYYDIVSKKDSALLVYDQAFKIAEKNNDLQAMASVYNNRGLIDWDRENFEKAMENYLESLKIFKTLRQDRGQANNLNNIGLLLTELDRVKESNNYHRLALKLRQKIGDKYGVGASLSNLSKNFGLVKQHDSSIYYSHKAIKVKANINDLRGLGITYNHLGLDYKRLEVYDSAVYYLKKADKIYTDLKNKRLKSSNNSALGSVYDNIGQFKNAADQYQIALENLSEEEILSQYKMQRLIAFAYKNLNEYKASNERFEIALALRDSIANENEKVATQEVFEKYQSAEKEKEILIQRAEIAEQNVLIQKRNYQVYGLIGLALILGLIGYLFYNQQKLKNNQLKKENELKDALLKIETQNKLQEQRLRISRDLHDNIGAQLTFIISSLDNLKYAFNIEDKALTTKLETISQFTSGTIYELRDTIWAMNKDTISFEDLKSRITNFIDKANEISSEINFDFSIVNTIDQNREFTSIEGINIHRVIQEAVNNSLKHAKASNISVDIDKLGSAIQIKIADNGSGFDVAATEKGNGLSNMEKRIKLLNGSYNLNSKLGEGTTVLITI